MDESFNSVAITTIDNPYNPFEDFIKWYMFDITKGYNTCSYLSRIMDLMNLDEENVELAIDEIIKNDFLNIYRKINK